MKKGLPNSLPLPNSFPKLWQDFWQCPCSFALPFGKHMQVAYTWTGVEFAWVSITRWDVSSVSSCLPLRLHSQTTRRTMMGRSKSRAPMHFQSRANWRMPLTSALVMKEVASLFLVIEEVVALGISLQMR